MCGEALEEFAQDPVRDVLRSPFDPLKPGKRRIIKREKEEKKTAKREAVTRTEEISKATSEAGRKERERRLRALGRSGTIITGGRGLTERATVTRKTLLGE